MASAPPPLGELRCIALVVDSRLSRLLANMAVAVGQLAGSRVPRKVFDDVPSAIAWARAQDA